MNNKIQEEYKWNIGCHYTPLDISKEFAKYVYDEFRKINKLYKNEEIRILDLFAGDGRLAVKLESIFLKINKNIKIDFVEINPEATLSIERKENYKIINTNSFNWKPKYDYDLVIANPPYLILNTKKSKELGFEWELVKKYAKNLYALGIKKCLELCKENGLVGIIAPFNWLCGINAFEFRKELKGYCNEISIRAFEQRGIFEQVNQDIGFQIFRKKKFKNLHQLKITFKYNGDKYPKIIEPNDNEFSNELEGIIVKTGSIVWNREKEKLSKNKNKALPLIYGGNINHYGKLNLNLKRYNNKQFVKKVKINKDITIKSPVILMRRTLRGYPGKWKVDSCIITKNFECMAENHVITIEIINDELNLYNFHNELIAGVEKYYYYSGSPSISVKVIKQIIYKIINSKSF